MAAPRTFNVTDPHMRGDDVESWQLVLKKQFAGWKVEYPIESDGYYGAITRDATATVLYGLGIKRVAMEHGVTPELRSNVSNKKLTVAERARHLARASWRLQLRKKHARSQHVAPPVAKIISSSWGWHPPGHDGVDLICDPDVPIYAICEAKVIDVRPSGWWGKGALPADKSKGDGIIQLECLTDVGPFRKGLHFGYGHAEKATVQVGEHVKAGQQIGRAGLANAWHVHFMVNNGNTTKGVGDHDPMPYVRHATNG